MKRFGIHVSGLVQGVGFRPFLHRLAMEHAISGSVRNTVGGVMVEAEGPSGSLLAFLSQIRDRAPTAARIDRLTVSSQPFVGNTSFEIAPSDAVDTCKGETVTTVPKDLAPCESCLAEMRDPMNRRYRYPFISCNICGPRYTIAEHLPFDRKNTAMVDFPLCSLCMMEFTSSLDRRFHAQTISCQDCGPRLFWRAKNHEKAGEEALAEALSVLRQGGVIALKGVGGYQLLCLAKDSQAVEHVRRIKDRPMKPMAVMAPTLEDIEDICHVDAFVSSWLSGAVAPIVLLERKSIDSGHIISPYVAPMTQKLGVMLPSSPLHQIILDEMKEWLIVTSANLSHAPTEISDARLQTSMGSLADGILFHNRRIVHVADDAVVRPITSAPLSNGAHEAMIILRSGRGIAPTEVVVGPPGPFSSLALGAHHKAAFAFRTGSKIIMSPFLGDWDHVDTAAVFEREQRTLTDLYGVDLEASGSIDVVASDAHPDYGSTQFAATHHPHLPHHQGIQHHTAHLASLIAEKGFVGRGLGVVWDGTGLGADGTIWGGEFFLVDGSERERIASMKPIPLWGGDKAVKEPRRVALGLLWETWQKEVRGIPSWQELASEREQTFLPVAFGLESGIVQASSMGRLFDGLAALLKLDGPIFYEAQSAMALEELAQNGKGARAYDVEWEADDTGILRWDWRFLVRAACKAISHADKTRFAADFHLTLARLIGDLAKMFEVEAVLVTGGVFQNALLTQMVLSECQHRGLQCVKHSLIPPGDGGLAVGQLCIAEGREHVSGFTSPHSFAR